jgi:hypothetical protein
LNFRAALEKDRRHGREPTASEQQRYAETHLRNAMRAIAKYDGNLEHA